MFFAADSGFDFFKGYARTFVFSPLSNHPPELGVRHVAEVFLIIKSSRQNVGDRLAVPLPGLAAQRRGRWVFDFVGFIPGAWVDLSSVAAAVSRRGMRADW